MRYPGLRCIRPDLPWAFVALAAAAIGCGDGAVRYTPDGYERSAAGLTAQQQEWVDQTLARLFGTPDEPALPEVAGIERLLDLDTLSQTAGPVESLTPGETHGLYRRHCARCHGVTGDGRGPTAVYQAPYPRDFRRGAFKWKSTFRAAPPTSADLDRVIEHGVAGTAMPSFALLKPEERVALRQHVQLLAIRGEVERRLVRFVGDEAPFDEPALIEAALGVEVLAECVEPVVSSWVAAPDRLAPVKPLPESDEAIARGRDLYHSEAAGCYKCHGPNGAGGAVAGEDYPIDYDDWTRPRVEALRGGAEARQLAARDLRGRPAWPRPLVGSRLRGGDSDADLFVRLHQGIAGTPMPAVGGGTDGSPGALADREVAALGAYVRSLLAGPPREAPL